MKDIKTKLTIKGIMLFEQLSGKSFYELAQDDMLTFMYAITVTNNPELRLSMNEFMNVLQNEKISKKILKGIEQEIDYVRSLTPSSKEGSEEVEETVGKDNVVTVSEIVSNLIISYGVDIDYALNRMELWEIVPLSNAVEDRLKSDMVDKRFWTYMGILPHIDSKKCKSPEDLIPFPWEKDKKKMNKEEAIEFMNKNSDKINAFLNQNHKENE